MRHGRPGTGQLNRVRHEARCAIYTRKSTEEGLTQEFNSLDAQREAAELHLSRNGVEWREVTGPKPIQDVTLNGVAWATRETDWICRNYSAWETKASYPLAVDRVGRRVEAVGQITHTEDRNIPGKCIIRLNRTGKAKSTVPFKLTIKYLPPPTAGSEVAK